jgi:hypothetical protein
MLRFDSLWRECCTLWLDSSRTPGHYTTARLQLACAGVGAQRCQTHGHRLVLNNLTLPFQSCRQQVPQPALCRDDGPARSHTHSAHTHTTADILMGHSFFMNPGTREWKATSDCTVVCQLQRKGEETHKGEEQFCYCSLSADSLTGQ